MKPYRPISSVNTAATRKKSIKCTKVSLYFYFLRERDTRGKKRGEKKGGVSISVDRERHDFNCLCHVGLFIKEREAITVIVYRVKLFVTGMHEALVLCFKTNVSLSSCSIQMGGATNAFEWFQSLQNELRQMDAICNSQDWNFAGDR